MTVIRILVPCEVVYKFEVRTKNFPHSCTCGCFLTLFRAPPIEELASNHNQKVQWIHGALPLKYCFLLLIPSLDKWHEPALTADNTRRNTQMLGKSYVRVRRTSSIHSRFISYGNQNLGCIVWMGMMDKGCPECTKNGKQCHLTSFGQQGREIS